MDDLLPPHALKPALKQYRKDVPSTGTVSFDKAQELLASGTICRGWMTTEEGRRYFHIIRSPQHFPEKTLMMAGTEKELFMMTIHLGMQEDIDFHLLVGEDEAEFPDLG